MKQNSPQIRKPTAQLSLWAAAPPQPEVVLSEVLKELSVLRTEQQRLLASMSSDTLSPKVEQYVGRPAQAEPDRQLSCCHQLTFEGLNWRIHTMDGQDHQIENSVGIRHIAVLLKSPNERFPPMELARLNGRKCKQLGQASTRLSSDHQAATEQGFNIRDSLDRNEAVIDQECDEQLRQEYKRLRSALDDAYELKNTEMIQQLQPKIEFLVKQFRQDHDPKGNIRLFDKREWERSRASVTNALTRSLAAIRRKSSEIADQIDSQIDRRAGFTYRPLESLPLWKVVEAK
ncbi:MAG: hypothetical protein R3B84_18750 [Zavarzinella sp.]